MFSFFKRKPSTLIPASFAFLKTDMHAHILPGIDDGAKTMADSLAMIEHMYQLGYQKIIATPHISLDFYPNTYEDVKKVLSDVQAAVAAANIPIAIDAAAEYMIDELFMNLIAAKSPLLTLSGNQVLVEMGYIQESPLLYDALFELQSSGYQAVLAHPERYKFYHKNPIQHLKHLKEKGFQLQLNILSLSGHYGKIVQHVAEQSIKTGLYNYCGSDIHHTYHVETMSKMNFLTNDGFMDKGTFMNSLL